MKVGNVVRTVLGVVSVALACNALAQPPGTSSDTQAAASASSLRVSDGTLRRQVKAALKKAKGLTAIDIAVRAKSGQITLQGTVKNQQQIDLAGQVASNVPGVTSVNNTLTVNRPTNSWR
ncbi:MULTISPECIES: BON domain-containing protein [Paraburkholderia]|uniref:BON domain-containing protein n=2 Tax=Paraburkholderia TaxID=1822464 RepID=A0A6J5FKA9_9BURK|nr:MULTISPECIES: BON domain-containing protein [Paraburkholderia]GGC65003.1 hypothetical protein GCM10011400_61230 [Paraburkholderia caffeinilytica]CAB3781948.1 hypothetical protein LMG28688_01389 [Paraburkholderia caffeinitolerans]CAB3802525.1 hypothetical protein LMG28690_05594 [Paraburkholderia caffeinilytica]